MPNRVIKDSIWSSPTLAKLPLDAQLHWPRWLLMADDWGCFNADPDVIRGLVYPKVPSMSIKKIVELSQTYMATGLLFAWEESERLWGYFTSWNGHQFCNVTHLDEDGKQLRHKRKTSEPPENELHAYLEQHRQIMQVINGKLERFRAVQNKYPNPNPNPNPNPISDPISKPMTNDQKVKAKPKTSIPSDFTISKAVKAWAKEKGHTRLESHFEHFTDCAKAKDYRYADWDAAFKNAIRNNWAKLDLDEEAPGEFDHLPKLRNEDYWICGCEKADTVNVCRHRHHGMTREESYAYDDTHGVSV